MAKEEEDRTAKRRAKRQKKKVSACVFLVDVHPTTKQIVSFCTVTLHTIKPTAVLTCLQQKGSAPLSMGQSLNPKPKAAGISGDDNPEQADLD